jgi:two-component system response regulator YesN
MAARSSHSHSEPESPTTGAKLQAALAIAARELSKGLSVKYVAGRLGVSRWHLKHLVKKETGRSFKAIIQMALMMWAKDLLSDPALRIKEVAVALGYTYPSSFSHDFKRCCGQSPSQFRARRTLLSEQEAG